MTPHIPVKSGPTDVDESSDMYDTVEWLLENVQSNNGRVGIWGISYPGFYAAASIIDSHPAIKAASPQAPIGDWFAGDDFHHNGAFFLQDGFRFFHGFESPEPNPTDSWGEFFQFPNDDAYSFYLDLGPLPQANEKYFHHSVAFWDSAMAHPSYDAFWKSRNIIPHMKNVSAAVMTVAGLFDAEDPYGPIQIYKSIERQNPGTHNTLVLGPWYHGAWARASGDELGNVSFEHNTGDFYRDSVDLAFFEFWLKDSQDPELPEVLAFCTGSNSWHRLDAWPPRESSPRSFYMHEGGRLSTEIQRDSVENAGDAYLSDPHRPVPYTQQVTMRRTREYMVEDQRFASRRPDVLVYETEILSEDVTLAGPVTANLFVSTTGTDADFLVKVIDVFPDSTSEHEERADKYMDVPMSGYQMLVRAEVMRARFRNGLDSPEPLVPGKVAEITFDTPDVFHTFKAGHRIMVHVQSSWFPLVDRNPQTFVDIYNATDNDFQVAVHTLHRSAKYPSRIRALALE
jgi:putative CocE/NonD family hydrolase